MSLRRMMAGLMVVTMVGVLGAAFAAEEQQPGERTITGKVKAAEAGAAYAATVEAQWTRGDQTMKVTLQVTNDEQGKKLAQEADGKTAEIKGTIERKGDERWLTVKEFKIVEEKPAQ